MRFDEVSCAALLGWHHASGRVLGSKVIDAANLGLEVHLLASRANTGACSIVVLGINALDGSTRSYAEVPLGDDQEAQQAWEHLRLQQVIEQARAALWRADRALRGMPGEQTCRRAGAS